MSTMFRQIKRHTYIADENKKIKPLSKKCLNVKEIPYKKILRNTNTESVIDLDGYSYKVKYKKFNKTQGGSNMTGTICV